MKAIFNGVTLAESDDTQVVEGNHYFPPESIDNGYLTRSRMRSLCIWKGLANYYNIDVEGTKNKNAAWTYRHPYPWIRKIKNHVAFWNGVEVKP